MKKFIAFLNVFLAFLLIFSSVGSNIAFAHGEVADEEGIEGEVFDWNTVDWEEIEVENTNDEVPIFENEDITADYEYIDLPEGVEYDSGFDFVVINEEDPQFQTPEFQPYLWHVVARVVLVGGKYVVKYGAKIFTKQPTTKAVTHTKSWQSAVVNVGNGNSVVIQRNSMVHILQNHHPNFWTGSAGKTLFNPTITTVQLRAKMIQILNQNRSKISQNGYGTINVKIEGQQYRLVVKNNRVSTFYPVD